MPAEITDDKGVSMMLVPAGEFTMGSNNYDEKPIRQVFIDAFYIDKYEVTNKSYKACVDVGLCELPWNTESRTRSAYYGNPEFDNYPVVYVNWYQANAYCEWRETSLPTEAQWEKAARGTDGRILPWGDNIDCNKTNYAYCIGDTTEVGSYDLGRSPYGIYDMAGNVWEWTKDYYSETYYYDSPLSNPFEPSTGTHRVLRGGSWQTIYGRAMLATFRLWYTPDNYSYYFGFRCAKDAIP